MLKKIVLPENRDYLISALLLHNEDFLARVSEKGNLLLFLSPQWLSKADEKNYSTYFY